MAEEQLPEEKDWTKYIWVGVVLLLVLMISGIWLSRRPETNISRVHVRHILVQCNTGDPIDRNRAMARINEIKSRLEKGESFDTLARKYSDDTRSGVKGGDLGWAPRKTYDENFDAYCWSGDIGKVSDVISTQFGFHLIEVVDRSISNAEQYESTLDRKVQELDPSKKAAEGE